MPMMDNTVTIVPYRYIPFDIGRSIDSRLKGDIQRYLLQQVHANEMEINSLLKSLSGDVVGAFQITERIRLYLYRFGIGVFSVEDIQSEFQGSDYAVEYCRKRKAAHEEYLTISNEFSEILYDIAAKLRGLASKNGTTLRVSASAMWEHHGFSYVMSISTVYLQGELVPYARMSDEEKANLQIMLEPSIAHAEDSLSCSIDAKRDEISLEKLNLEALEEPIDWIRSSDFSIYISWAAVLLYASAKDTSSISVLESLEADLQAMWLYTYCLYENMKNYNSSYQRPVSALRNDLYQFRRKYNEFKNIDDSSVTAYITRIRDELIRTSGIDKYAAQYIEYIEFCISETESIHSEKQKKYAWLNEILLFVIAFVQIAPMLYDFMIGNYHDVEFAPILCMIAIVIGAIVIIIRKN